MQLARRLSHAMVELGHQDAGGSSAEAALVGSLALVLFLLLLLALAHDA